MRVQNLLLVWLLFRMDPSLADLDPNRPLLSPLAIDAFEQVLWPLSASEKSTWNQYNIEEQQAKIVLDDRLQSDELRYFASSLYLGYLADFSDYESARYYCEKYPPKPEHYEYSSTCLRMSRQPLEDITRALDDAGAEAERAWPERLVANNIYSMLGSLLAGQGRIHAAIDAFQKAQRATLPDLEESIVEAKLNLAITYANPLLSRALQQKALDYYAEVRDWYAKQGPAPGNHAFVQMKVAIYNRGVAYALNFKDY